MLTSLTTRSFRNLADQDWRPEAGPNLVFGPNGAGKSSLLEAVYLVATTRSFRTNRLSDCCRLDGTEFLVGADTESDERARLEVAWSVDGKRRSVNGSTGPIIEHLASLPVVGWTARDSEIFQGPPAVRRRLLDRGIVSERPASLAVLSDYRRALEAKRSALDSQAGLLEEWNRMLARSGAELAERRARWVERLEAALEAVLDRSDLELGPVELRYRPSPSGALGGPEEFFRALEDLSRREMARRSVLAGPHRDDVEILWRNGSVGRMASAGERKLLGIALTLAQVDLLAESGPPPLLLIDDLDAELDNQRVDQIWRLLGGASQLIAATSRKSVVNELESAAEWELKEGILASLRDGSKNSL